LISQAPAGQGKPSAADLASFKAFGAWYAQNMVGGNPPEVELHLSFEENANGSVGKPRPHPAINAQDGKWEEFTSIHVPVLAIFACPVDYGPSIDSNSALREKIEAYNTVICQAQAAAIQKDVPSAHVVLWQRTYHYLFIARQNDVLKELRAFIGSLPR
jgi:hypothetical protein